MWHYTVFFFSKHLEYIRGYDIPDSYALKTHLESLTGEVIESCQEKRKKQSIPNISQKTLNSVNNVFELLCSGSKQQKFYTTSTNT